MRVPRKMMILNCWEKRKKRGWKWCLIFVCWLADYDLLFWSWRNINIRLGWPGDGCRTLCPEWCVVGLSIMVKWHSGGQSRSHFDLIGQKQQTFLSLTTVPRAVDHNKCYPWCSCLLFRGFLVSLFLPVLQFTHNMASLCNLLLHSCACHICVCVPHLCVCVCATSVCVCVCHICVCVCHVCVNVTA